MEEGLTFPLKKGVMFCSRPGKVHQITTELGLDILYVAFDIDENRSSAEEIQLFEEVLRSESFFLENADPSYASLLWQSLLIPQSQEYVLAPELLADVGHSLLRAFAELFVASRQVIRDLPSNQTLLLNKAKMYIRDNMTQQLNISQVSAYLNISERHLSRLFRGNIHESFTSYVRQERIREASRLLIKTDWPIKQIADHVGFSSIHYFTKIFTRYMRISPAKYRNSENPVPFTTPPSV